MNYIQSYQLECLLVLSAICLIISVFTTVLKFEKKRTKFSLLTMEICAFILTTSDRFAYIFRGNETSLGFWMVRITNFLVFFCILAEDLALNFYLVSVINLKKTPKRAYFAAGVLIFGMVCLIISQFTGIYYSFDSTNHYKRGSLFFICYLFPIVALTLQSTMILEYYKKISKRIRFSILMFPILFFAASIIQLFVYGISINTMSSTVLIIVFFICAIFEANGNLEQAKSKEIQILKEQSKNMQELFAQTAEALAGAIDAKDKYTHGHSVRVAEYSKKMAEMAGKNEEECNEIYFAGLLHDVGKIGIPDGIINKDCKLSDEEFAEIKKHPGMGNEILRSISKLPYLSVGAHYHHERYDGRGYPEGLKATDIPEFARIIAVADAYDAMTSKRSYRDPIPQQKVREEIVKGMGTQFDPEYAKLMIHLIDMDSEYTMKERSENKEFSGIDYIAINEHRNQYSEGIIINPYKVTIRMHCKANELNKNFYPSLVLFDSLDARIHVEDREITDLMYNEYLEIRGDGEYIDSYIRNVEVAKNQITNPQYLMEYDFVIEAVKHKDHILLKMNDGQKLTEATIALPDSTRYAYISLTGENCIISNIQIERDEELFPVEKIKRIAEEVSYIDGPEGDIPNVQIDSWRTAHSKGILLDSSKKICFYAKSLPFARLVWHCAFVVLYTSDDNSVYGPNYRELGLIRMDGEGWNSDPAIINNLILNKTDDFHGWNEWKQKNKEGHNIEISVVKNDESLIFKTESGGLHIKDIITLTEKIDNICVALTGDQCVIENICIENL